ncbi:MAG: hypothetical protein F6K56_44405 [Moorea sp. SIO3G5]|nr:hypothetical protein [Moorena sp. SIO3G5]
MPVVCDFTEIIGDNPVNITSAVLERNFNTGGRHSSAAFLIFNVRGITSTSVPVKVNNRVVGNIFPYPNSNTSHWFTQMISLSSSQLNNGNNEVQIETPGNDSFQIKNMVCFFHQNV